MSALKAAVVTAVTLLLMPLLVHGGQFVSNCNGPPCPNVSWTDAAGGEKTTFVLQSSMRNGMNNYVAFAFATAQTMASTQVVVDCYDVNGTLAMGTSKNVPGGNINSQADLPLVTGRNITLSQGVYTCVFNMTLPASPMYAIIAEGKMNVSFSPPTKLYHGVSRYSSVSSYQFNSTANRTESVLQTAVTMKPNSTLAVRRGEFIASCSVLPCPSIAWEDAGGGQTTRFVLKSSLINGTNNYVAFAFALTQNMASTQVVVDCYDINGTLAMGTSKNVPGGNINSQADLPLVTGRNITLSQGVYTCVFNMTLPASPMYAIIAEGKMNNTSPTPSKLYHWLGRYWSLTQYQFNASAITRAPTATPSGDVTVSASLLVATVMAALAAAASNVVVTATS